MLFIGLLGWTVTHLKNTLALFFKDPAIYPGYTGNNISELTLNYL